MSLFRQMAQVSVQMSQDHIAQAFHFLMANRGPVGSDDELFLSFFSFFSFFSFLSFFFFFSFLSFLDFFAEDESEGGAGAVAAESAAGAGVVVVEVVDDVSVDDVVVEGSGGTEFVSSIFVKKQKLHLSLNVAMTSCVLSTFTSAIPVDRFELCGFPVLVTKK